MVNDQKHNKCINIPPTQTLGLFYKYCHAFWVTRHGSELVIEFIGLFINQNNE
jgi:hypothetical protein